jgi:hypothetical protein
MVDVAHLHQAIDEKLIDCQYLTIWEQTMEPSYVNVRCGRDNKTVEIWNCIECLGNTLENKFTEEQLYKTITPVIVEQVCIEDGPCIQHMHLMTDICPRGYVCDGCDKAGPDLYLDRYCRLHECWVSQ